MGRCHTCATGEADALGHSYFLDFLFLQMTFYMVKLARSRASFSIYCCKKHNHCVSKCHFSLLTDLNCPQDSGGCIMQYTAEMDTRFHLTSSEHFSMWLFSSSHQKAESFPFLWTRLACDLLCTTGCAGSESVPVLSPGLKRPSALLLSLSNTADTADRPGLACWIV